MSAYPSWNWGCGYDTTVGLYPTIAFEGDSLLLLGHVTAFRDANVVLINKFAAPAECQRSDVQRQRRGGRGLVVLQAADNLVGLILHTLGSIEELILSLGSDLVNPIKTACLDKRSKYLCWWVFIFI